MQRENPVEHPIVGRPATTEERLRLFFEAGRRLNRSLEPAVLFSTLTEILRGLMPLDGLVVSSFDPTDDSIHCDYAWVAGSIIDPETLPPVTLNRDGAGMQSRVILTGQAALFDVPQSVQDPRGTFVAVDSEGTQQPLGEGSKPVTQTALMVPMIIEDSVTGVVQVMSDQSAAYGQDDLELLEGLVLQLSAAANNAKLYELVREELGEREAAEQALRASEERFRLLADLMPTIAWWTNIDGSTEYVNKSYYQYSGLPSDVPGEAGWELVVHPEDLHGSYEAFQKCAEVGSTWEYELRLKRHDGLYRWHLSRMAPVRNAENEVMMWLGTSADIHAQKEAEAELAQRVAERTVQLEAAVRELEGFTYSVSHDLRSPLRAINSTSAMLRNDYGDSLPPEALSLLKRQSDAAKKMADLIDDLLRLSRLGRQEMMLSECDLSLMAQEIVEEIQADGRDSSAQFVIQPDVMAIADRRLIRLVLVNLLENAAKFSPEGGTIKFSASGGEYSISDEGIGFDMQYVDHLFKPFERLVRDEDFPGTGIGLANVKRIVDRHGGKVRAASQLGKGSTFYWSLP